MPIFISNLPRRKKKEEKREGNKKEKLKTMSESELPVLCVSKFQDLSIFIWNTQTHTRMSAAAAAGASVAGSNERSTIERAHESERERERVNAFKNRHENDEKKRHMEFSARVGISFQSVRRK
jgi:hypothetical protein